MKYCRQFVPSENHDELWMPCGIEAPYVIRGTHLCPEHYIEALEHSAHLDFGQLGVDSLPKPATISKGEPNG